MSEAQDVSTLSFPGYNLVARIGRGGFSVVYEAVQLSLNRAVAVKVLLADLGSPAERRRFERERDLLSRLSEYRYVVDVYDAGVSPEGRPFIVMRLYRRGSLARKVEGSGPLSLPEAASILTHVASALDAAHELGVIHRDVSPGNILITDDDEPVLADFGIAALSDPSEATTTFAFTSAHAAPEVVERNTYSQASDVYSLASTAYYLLAGRAPYATARQLVRDPGTVLPPLAEEDLPRELIDVLQRGMARDPGERFGSAGSFAAALADLASVQAPDSPTISIDPVGREVDKENEKSAAAGGSDSLETLFDPDPQVAGSQIGPQSRPQTSPEAHDVSDVDLMATVIAVSGPARREAADTAARPDRQAKPGHPPGSRPRRVLWWCLAPILVVVTMGVVAAGVYAGTRHTWVVRGQADEVVIQHGPGARPLGLALTTFERTNVSLGLLPSYARASLDANIRVGSRREALDAVERLKAQAQVCTTSMADGCPVRPLLAPQLHLAALKYPKGNTVEVTVSGVDKRAGVTTTLLVDGQPPASPCPSTFTVDQGCTFSGSFAQSYAVSLVVAGPPGSVPVTVEDSVTTRDKPSLRVYSSDKFKDDSSKLSYCYVDIELNGLAAKTTYPVTLSYSSAPSDRTKITTDSAGDYDSGPDVKFSFGYRDPTATNWVQAQVAGLTVRKDPWACS